MFQPDLHSDLSIRGYKPFYNFCIRDLFNLLVIRFSTKKKAGPILFYTSLQYIMKIL